MTEPHALRWNLPSLYASVDDPALPADLAAAIAAAAAFRRDWRGRIDAAAVTAPELAAALERHAGLQLQALRPYLYAQLLFAADGGEPRHARLMAEVREGWQELGEAILFFELELLRLPQEHFARLRGAPELAAYGHYLDTLRAHAPYTLGEDVEQAIKRKDLTGKEAFVQLFDELGASLRYRFRMPGEAEEREVPGEELLALLYHPDRETRERSFATFLETHGAQALVLTACFNNLLLDHSKEADLRGYPDRMTPTCLSSETSPELVERMLAVSEEHYPLARRYFAVKQRLLGYERLKNTDLYAPLAGGERTFTFDQAWALVAEAYAGFHPELAQAVGQLLPAGRLDVAPRPAKSGGAFCMGLYPGADPYVLLNYTGTLRDVTTLAHELGHAAHYVLAGGQNFYHYHPPLPLAETASVFGEMLVTRHLLAREQDRQVRIALLCAKLEEIIATTFRQAMLTRFEQAAHARRDEGLLSADDLCALWLEQNGRLFGDAVEMIPAYRWGWSYISHFIHARFYCFSYVFGELLVLALYRRYLEEGAAFAPRYLDLLRAGGSAPPAQLLRPLGIDLAAPEFWAGGYRLVAEMLDELEGLIGAGC
ncbi:MAG: M3 family oligoendopeptidase [Deltaproteobacteria bacterium]|nr:MAG: M3 family oligoendopeptidase [Deltaproteobacteria bacterium]